MGKSVPKIDVSEKYKERGAYHWIDYKQTLDYRHHADYIARKFNDKKGTLLDVGCGDGLISVLLSQELSVTGIDIDELAIWLAKKKLKRVQEMIDVKVKFMVKDVFKINTKFDYLLASEVIEHLPNPDKFLKKIKSLFREGALITTPKKKGKIDIHHYREYTRKEFEELLDEYFDFVDVCVGKQNLYAWVK